MNRTLSFCFLVLCFCIPAVAQTTEFNYQGRLTDGSLAANGTYEMRFRLFDAETGGTQQPQPTPITLEFTVAGNNPVTVSSGVFTVSLDFTNAAFTGTARFLEISVRRTESDPFVVLDPRQPITSAPHNIRSLSSGSSDSLSVACVLCVTDAQIQSIDGNKVNGEVASSANSSLLGGVPASRFVQSDTNGNVGIGATPGTGSKLTIGGQVEITAGGLKFPDASTQNSAGLASVATTGQLTGNGTPGSPLGLPSPVIVVIQDNPARQPFFINTTNQTLNNLYTVPTGKVLVIEHVAGVIRSPTANNYLDVNISDGVAAGTLITFTGSKPFGATSETNWYYSSSLKRYLVAGRVLVFNIPAGMPFSFQSFSITGYLVDVP